MEEISIFKAFSLDLVLILSVEVHDCSGVGKGLSTVKRAFEVEEEGLVIGILFGWVKVKDVPHEHEGNGWDVV